MFATSFLILKFTLGRVSPKRRRESGEKFEMPIVSRRNITRATSSPLRCVVFFLVRHVIFRGLEGKREKK